MTDEDHHFDRRRTDVTVSALATRIVGIERRVEVVEHEVRNNSRELVANTALTRQAHTIAERVEQNTSDILHAVKWLSTTKKIVIALVACVGALAAAGTAVMGFLRLLG